jgi:hypothetical protein
VTREAVLSIFVIAAAVPANLFCLLYSYWKNWWRVDVGRHIFLLMLGLAGLIDLALLRRTIGQFPGDDFIGVSIYGLICYQLYRQFWFLVKYNSPWGERAMERQTRRIKRERREGIKTLKENR